MFLTLLTLLFGDAFMYSKGYREISKPNQFYPVIININKSSRKEQTIPYQDCNILGKTIIIMRLIGILLMVMFFVMFISAVLIGMK